jgi:peroxiredoxin
MPPAPEAPPQRIGVVVAQLAFVVVAALFVYGFVSVSKEGETRRECGTPCYLHPDYLAAERTAPDFTLPDMTGRQVSLSGYRGKVVVLNFWSKSCGPCMQEMPEFAEFAQVLAPKSDVVVLTISTDEGPDDVRDTLKTVLKAPPPFPVLFDPDTKVMHGKYGENLVPETWFIDKQGVIRARFDGAREWTNPLYVNFVDGLRSGEYCPVKIEGRGLSGKAGKICEELAGS